jgi:hypothetical protein
MHMDKKKAGRTAAAYESKAAKTRSKSLREKLLGRADVFRFIEACLGEKTPTLRLARQAVSRASRKKARVH